MSYGRARTSGRRHRRGFVDFFFERLLALKRSGQEKGLAYTGRGREEEGRDGRTSRRRCSRQEGRGPVPLLENQRMIRISTWSSP